MNRRWLLSTILALTTFAVMIIIALSITSKFNKLVVNEKKWDEIKESRTSSTSIQFEKIIFNDYNLIIDEEESKIYYSIVDTSTRFNPSVEFKTDSKGTKVAINKKIEEENISDSDIKILLYDKDTYHEYTLVITDFPILNISYDEEEDSSNKIEIELELFDNHLASPQRTLKSLGELKIKEENQEYSISLKKKTLGRNERENHISLFGLDKQDEYTLKKVEEYERGGRFVQLFINNKKVGVFEIEAPPLKENEIPRRNRDLNH